MNFLAHIYLSNNDELITLGNFVADLVKGKKAGMFSDKIRLGIQLHREIDRFTDSHELVKAGKARLWDKYRHFASVIMDVYYDHILALNWSKYHEEPLEKFAANFYEMIGAYYTSLPLKIQAIIYYMSKDDWLSSYSTVEGIETTLKNMSKRSRQYESRMEEAGVELVRDLDDLKAEFDVFFPQLADHCKRFLENSEVNPYIK